MGKYSDIVRSEFNNFAFGRPDPPGTVYSLYKIINNKSTEIANSTDKYQMLQRKKQMEDLAKKTMPSYVVRSAKNLWS